MLYVCVKLFIAVVLPFFLVGMEIQHTKQPLSLKIAGKWLIFCGIGVGSLVAGLKQIFEPEFTLEKIFLITNYEYSVIVKELGIANLSIGLLGSFFISSFLESSRSLCGRFVFRTSGLAAYSTQSCNGI
jgi:hypothetical protein